MRIAVVGASGFVGSAVTESLRECGCEVVTVRAPRVTTQDSALRGEMVESLVDKFWGVYSVVNCSGNPDASQTDIDVLMAANAVSPTLVATAAKRAGVDRLIHVSSAVVQGRRSELDESSDVEEFSPYARSKAEGERQVRGEFEGAVIYRPPSVHSPARRVTLMTARIARSPFATVASPGDQHSPQALIENVASAVVFLATVDKQPPPVVIHPWEGLTSSDVMELLGGKRPKKIPAVVARALCRALALVGTYVPQVSSNARRVEMLWFGQDQADSWLTAAGWAPPLGREAWRRLGEVVRSKNE